MGADRCRRVFTSAATAAASGRTQSAEKFASYANKLAQTLSSLEPSSRFTIAYQMCKGKVGAETPFLAWYSGIRDNDRRLSEAPARLERLAAAVAEAAAGCRPPSLPHNSVIRYLILKDLAAMFEFATEQSSGRRVRTDAHVDAGQDYGPFWDFVSAVWPMIFGSTNGLRYALKFWASAREASRAISCDCKYGLAPPRMANFRVLAVWIRHLSVAEPATNRRASLDLRKLACALMRCRSPGIDRRHVLW